MEYIDVLYKDFKPYKMERLEGGIKKYSWERIVNRKEMDDFSLHMRDSRTRVIIESDICMPFDVYVIPNADADKWAKHLHQPKNDQFESSFLNCVYLLWGKDFIYAGKSCNGDRIADHVRDEDKKGFDYQMLFVQNNFNSSTQTYWTRDFMSYLESLMIDRIKNCDYCKNKNNGKSCDKSRDDLNMDDTKEAFANNVVSLMYEVFIDISHAPYLVPNNEFKDSPSIIPQINTEINDDMGIKWEDLFSLANQQYPDNSFSKLRATQSDYVSSYIDRYIPNAFICCIIKKRSCRVELNFWTSKDNLESNAATFTKLQAMRYQIESEMECSLEWTNKDGVSTRRIYLKKELSYNIEGNRSDIVSFFVQYYQKFYDIIPKYYKIACDNCND